MSLSMYAVKYNENYRLGMRECTRVHVNISCTFVKLRDMAAMTKFSTKE